MLYWWVESCGDVIHYTRDIYVEVVKLYSLLNNEYFFSSLFLFVPVLLVSLGIDVDMVA